MILRLAERVSQSSRIDKVIITTSIDPSDDPLEKVAQAAGVLCSRGSLENVMERICQAAERFNCDDIVEILGDNPLIHSSLVDDVIDYYRNGNYDYAATVTQEYSKRDKRLKLFSLGVRVQVYRRRVAESYVHYPESISNPSAHPCSYIYEHPEDFKVGYLEASGKWAFMNQPDINLAVNYPEDFERTRKIFEQNYPKNSNFPLEWIYSHIEREKGILHA